MNPEPDLSPRRAPRALPLAVLAAAAGFILLFFGYHLFGKLPVSTDISMSHLQFFALRFDGSLPLWNPYSALGMAMETDMQFAALYPPRWPFFFLPWAAWLNPYLAIHYGIAFGGTYGLLRASGLGRTSSFGGAAAYLGGGFMIAYIITITVFCAACWLPLLLWGASSRRAWGPALSGLALTMIIMLGSPHLMIYGTLGYAIVLLTRIITERTGAPLGIAREAGRAIGGFVLGVAAGAASLVPSLVQVFQSVRTEADVLENLNKSLEWREIGFAVFGGGGGRITPEFNDKALYIGGVGLLLALLGAFDRRSPSRTLRRSGLLLILAGTALALGKNAGWQFIFPYLPGLQWLAGPGRALVLTAMGFSLLIGLGLESLGRAGWKLLVAAIGSAAALGAAFLILGANLRDEGFQAADLARWLLQPDALIGERFPIADLPLTLGLASAALLAQPLLKERTRLLLAALLVAQLFHFSPRVRPRAEPPAYFDPPGPVRFLRGLPESPPFRVCAIDPLQAHDTEWENLYKYAFLSPNSSTLFGLEEIGIYNPLMDAGYRDFIRSTAGQAPFNDRLRVLTPAKPDAALFRRLNVKYMIGHPLDRRVTHLPFSINGASPVHRVSEWPGAERGPITAWHLVSFFAAPPEARIQPGEVVAELILQAGSRLERFPIRYGEHTALLNDDEAVLRNPNLRLHMRWRRFTGESSGSGRIWDQLYRSTIEFPSPIRPDAVYFRLARQDCFFQVSAQALRLAAEPVEGASWVERFADPVAPVFELQPSEERATLSGRYELGDGNTATIDPKSTVAAAITSTSRRHARSSMHVESGEGGLLVVRDGWHPDWRVRIDGQSAPLLKVDGLFRGVVLPGGAHDVEFRFVPKLLFSLLPLSLGALGLLLFLIMRGVRSEEQAGA